MQNSRLPLSAIRAFEATIRLGSITSAAVELNVTQGAVSRHVKNLEKVLATALVRRDGHSIQPLPIGSKLAAAFTESLQIMTKAIDKVTDGPEIFKLQVAPTFANRWLVPRLGAMARAAPDIELALITTLANDRFDSRSFDAGIVYGDGNWPELEKTLLLKEYLVPVSAPILMNGQFAPQAYSDLNNYMLLHAKIDHSDWLRWLGSINKTDVKVDTGPAFETMDLAIVAAERGYGVTLGNLEFVKKSIDAKRLVLPFGPAVFSGFGYYLVYPKYAEFSESIRNFFSWVCENSPESNKTIDSIVKQMNLSCLDDNNLAE